jgi:hypothetical protein
LSSKWACKLEQRITARILWVGGSFALARDDGVVLYLEINRTLCR